jgi:hypothetical protein
VADYTTTALLASVRRRGLLPPTADETLTTEDYLEFANDELISTVVPLVLSTREEYFVVDADITTVPNQAEYDIPDRALGMKLRDVRVANGSGRYLELPRLEPERVNDYAQLANGVSGYFLKANQVVLVPTPTSATTLRVSYYRRPNRLVTTDAVLPVTGRTSSTAATYAGTPPTTFTSGTSVDVIKHAPGFDSFLDGGVINTPSGGTVTFTTGTLPTTVTAGDYVCLAGETPIPQIPPELHPFLAQRVLVRALEALGSQKQAVAEATAERMRVAALEFLTPRADGSSRIIVNRHGPGYWKLRQPGPRWA